MANLSVTAANVSYVVGEITKEELVAGATITAGQAIYKDAAASNVAKLAQSDGTTAEAAVYGIALCSASTGQPVVVAKTGDFDIGGTLTVGTIYVLSQTAGAICPVADLTTGDYVSIIGVGTAADNLELHLVNSAVEVPA